MAKKKTPSRGEVVRVGGYSRLTKSRHKVIDDHLSRAMAKTTDLREIIKAGPPPRSTSYRKVYDDDIDAILEAQKLGWTAVEITMLFTKSGRPVSYSLIRDVLKGRVKKGRGLRSEQVR